MTAPTKLTHLSQLEAESIHIMREVAAQCERPVMLYSIGKDSAVMLHLAMKAFYPAKPPFPLLHVDTTWKFREMIEFRDRLARELGLPLGGICATSRGLHGAGGCFMIVSGPESRSAGALAAPNPTGETPPERFMSHSFVDYARIHVKAGVVPPHV